ncbi:RNA polymerase sigma factor RpoH [Azospirillum picis]|uniref:RNA polymerase sigma factor RpoH n=1 Tax=Azospirillum picis TaxID=488438 RepID=A0ABU0MDF2_9PROT|nr:RNA polymerase sigma factor RpoH [Azospirillum picis]MBP2297514.1 RNA polymerase sigma-32 factor [Azospirillum picis]MDQ0531463.1 RNA polymerase sigma-32 factor [Azospirillum picis]
MSTAVALRSPDSSESLSRYINETHRYPVLGAEDEYMLAKAWTEHGDVEAAQKLVTSHLRLVVKIAGGYRGYGLPLSDLIAEGNLGLMTAVKKFEPERGFRLSTYAMWWIKASIQDYILRSWSLVKIGTTAAQKKLFFSLGRLKRKLGEYGNGDLQPDSVTRIANDLSVPEEDVVAMNRRLSGPVASLNAPLTADGDSAEWQDLLADDRPTVEDTLVERGEASRRSALLHEAMGVLNDRERDILTSRRLSDAPLTLEDLSVRYGVSRERIRQIEERAFEKVARQTRVLAAAA